MANNEKDITNNILLQHMRGMKHELQQAITQLGKKVDKLERRIDTMEDHLTRRIDALEEDLIATIEDTMKIRRHVGMPVPSE